MISPFVSRIIALALLRTLLASAQVTSATENINPPTQVSAPFSIPANSSAFDTNIPLSVATTSTTSTLSPSLISTVTPVPSSSSSSLDSISSSVIASISVSLSINATNTKPSLAISSTGPTSNGLPNAGSTTQPPGVSSTISTSTGPDLPSGITPPPSSVVTILPTGAEVQSSASDLSVGFVGIFPLLNSWINTPDVPRVTAVTDELDIILPKAVDMLGKFPKPPNGVEPCNGQRRRSEPGQVISRSLFGGLFKTAFSLLSCVVDITNKVKDEVIKGTTDTVDTVKKLQDTLKPMIDALNEVEETEPSGSASEQPSSTEAKSSSSSSCTLQTVSNCNVHCTAIATTTMGGPQRRDEKDGCTTACESPITKCGATGVTSVSTVTSTTTASQYVCEQSSCAACNNNDRAPLDDPILAGYSTASNGVLYKPAPTVSGSLSKNLLPRETGLATGSHQRRALSNPNDYQVIDDVHFSWTGGVSWWLRVQLSLSPHRLEHGKKAEGKTTTGITHLLEDTPNSWGLVDLYGCTSVIVISRKRMYMTHIWEGPTMNQPWTENFQTQALDPLRNGDIGTPGLQQFAVPGGEFEDTPENNVRAFIITPLPLPGDFHQPTGQIRYTNEVNQIKALLEDILGRGGTTTIPYVSTAADPTFDTPYGKVLIQYDPVNQWSNFEGCDIHHASIELWFEDDPAPRYKDDWVAFLSQLVLPDSLLGRSLSDEDGQVGVLGDGKASAFEKESWKKSEALRRRAECARPSQSASASSASPTSSSLPSSATQDPTTLQTSVISSSSEDSTSFSDTSTSSSASPSPPTPTPPPAPSKALSIVLKYLDEISEEVTRHNTWQFYETEYGSQADVCSGFTEHSDDRASDWVDPKAVESPPWPHTSFSPYKVYGEYECRYFSDGKGPGSLTCPSFNGRVVDCKEDPERTQKSATHRCKIYSYHRAVMCEW